jgi:succinate-semialdehyde dehydrogenase/glutarate-semialdehyde dehydrogenase
MITTHNPATGEVLASHDELSAPQIEAALARAHDTFGQWRLTPVPERMALLGRLADAFEANTERLARQATLEMGKTVKSARAEVAKCAALFRHLSQTGDALLADEHYALAGGGTARGVWLPIGPVLAIMPWNFPYWQVVRFMAPAILAGNVGLLKHASLVQGCAAMIEEMATSAGAPAGLFANLPITSKPVAGIIADDRVAAVTLTGSEGAGRAVAEAAGTALKKVVLELGGSDPFIVMPSADLAKAVPAAVTARIQNTGQSCICGKRMIVHAAIHDAFLDQFTAAMAAVKAGDPFAEDTDMGPLSSLEQRETVIAQLDKARAEGAELTGGEVLDGPGAYIAAGVLTGVAPGTDTATEEIFGPIAQVYRAADIDEAITIANAIPFGLGSSVWTDDAQEKARFTRDIAAGMTAINQVLASAPEAPFGGIKRSGHGRELSHHGLHEFMNLKTVMEPAGS